MAPASLKVPFPCLCSCRKRLPSQDDEAEELKLLSPAHPPWSPGRNPPAHRALSMWGPPLGSQGVRSLGGDGPGKEVSWESMNVFRTLCLKADCASGFQAVRGWVPALPASGWPSSCAKPGLQNGPGLWASLCPEPESGLAKPSVYKLLQVIQCSWSMEQCLKATVRASGPVSLIYACLKGLGQGDVFLKGLYRLVTIDPSPGLWPGRLTSPQPCSWRDLRKP